MTPNRAEVVDRQPAVEVDVVERLRQVSRLAFVGIAVQQHDRRVTAGPQKVQQMQRIRPVQIAVAVAEPDMKLQWLTQAQSLMRGRTAEATRSVSRVPGLSRHR